MANAEGKKYSISTASEEDIRNTFSPITREMSPWHLERIQLEFDTIVLELGFVESEEMGKIRELLRKRSTTEQVFLENYLKYQIAGETIATANHEVESKLALCILMASTCISRQTKKIMEHYWDTLDEAILIAEELGMQNVADRLIDVIPK